MSEAADFPAGPVAVIGGTGQLGSALAARWARAGIEIVLGSRDARRSAEAAVRMALATGGRVTGLGNAAAAEAARTVVLTVPFAAQASTLAEIRHACAGKVVVDATVPLVPPKVMRVQLPPEGSAALIAQQLLGPDVTVVSAFHNVAAAKLARDETVDCDVLVFGDGPAARSIGVALASAAGLRGLQAGALANSVASEALTSVLIFINKTYAVDGAGLRITGALKAPA